MRRNHFFVQTMQVSVSRGFFSRLDCLITPLIETHGLEREILSVKDGSGEVYLEECLVIPFMTYVNHGSAPI